MGEDEELERMAEQANVELAARGELPVESLSTREKVALANMRAQQAADMQRRMAELERSESPEAMRAAGGQRMVNGRLMSIPPKTAQAQTVEQLAANTQAQAAQAIRGAPQAPSFQMQPQTPQDLMAIANDPTLSLEQRQQAAFMLTQIRGPSRTVEAPGQARMREMAAELEPLSEEEMLQRRTALKAAQVAGEEQAVYQASLAEKQKEFAAAEAEQRNQFMAGYETERRKYLAMKDQVGSMRVDAGRFWANRGTGMKVTAAIGSMLGGALQGLRGGPNPMMNFINESIERDIAEQESNILKSRGALEDEKGLLAQMRLQFDDDRVARLATHAAYLEAAETELQSMLTTLATEEQRALGAANLAVLQQDKARIEAELDVGIQNMVARAGGGRPYAKYGEFILGQLEKKGEFAEKVGLEKMKMAGEAGEKETATFERFSDKEIASGIPALRSSLRGVRQFVSALPGAKTDGIGRVSGRLAKTEFNKWLGSQRSVEFRQEFGAMLADFIRSKSGKQASDQERDFLFEIMEGNYTVESYNRALTIINRGIKAEKATIGAPDPEAYKRYEANVERLEGESDFQVSSDLSSVQQLQ